MFHLCGRFSHVNAFSLKKTHQKDIVVIGHYFKQLMENGIRVDGQTQKGFVFLAKWTRSKCILVSYPLTTCVAAKVVISNVICHFIENDSINGFPPVVGGLPNTEQAHCTEQLPYLHHIFTISNNAMVATTLNGHAKNGLEVTLQPHTCKSGVVFYLRWSTWSSTRKLLQTVDVTPHTTHPAVSLYILIRLIWLSAMMACMGWSL